MFRRPLVALLLSLAYGLIAVAGHGLHALAPCGDADCGGSCDVVATACNCGCPHRAPASGKATDGPSCGPIAGNGHNPHNCAVCTTLAKVKVGHASHLSSIGFYDLVIAGPPSAAVANNCNELRAYSPRGPPPTNS